MENQENKALTRAQKTEATRQIVRERLAVKPTKHNELIDEVANAYVLRYGEEGENLNDVRGRVGSVLDIMKKNGEVMQDNGVYALKARMMMPPPAEEAPAPKKTRSRAKKAAEKEEKAASPAAENPTEEKPAEEKKEQPAPKKPRGRGKKAVEAKEENQTPAPVEKAPAPEKAEEKTEEKAEKPAPKKRGRKAKAPAAEEKPQTEEKPAAETLAQAPVEKVEAAPLAQVKEEKQPLALVEKPKGELAPKSVMDMSFLFGDKAKAQKKAPVKEGGKPLVEKGEEKGSKEEAPAPATAEKAEPAKKPAPATEGKAKVEKKAEKPGSTEKPAQKTAPATRARTGRTKEREALTPDEKLKESFLKRMRTLGGDYFEYYSIYLLERYSIQNGRRLEGLRVSGGDHDGGIDGELELTDALGFRETIYIQSKNWDPEKGKEEKWVVGETLLQQFIGACACRQAKEGKLHARGIFITTSRFTPEAKRILQDMGDKIVGYDGNDLYEAAKECSFGLLKKNGEWTLDEKLLSGGKAFFQMTL